MADTNVQNVVMNFMAAWTGASESLSQVKTSSGESFSKQLDKTSKQTFNTDTDKKQEVTTKTTNANDELKKNQNTSKKQKELEEKTAAEESMAYTDKAEVVENVVEELKENVADELNISVDELENVMEELNLTNADLFDAQKLGTIVLETNGIENVQELLFDSTAADEFKSVMSLLENAGEELKQAGIEITDEAFVKLTAEDNYLSEGGQMPEDVEMTYVSAEQSEPKENALAQVQTETVSSDNVAQSVKADDKLQQESKSDTTEVKDEVVYEEISESAEAQENADTDGESLSDDKGSKESDAKSDNNLAAGSNTSVTFNVVEQIQTELADRVGQTQAESIMNQLIEQIKLNVNEEFQSMEMQLYPEHLGKVGISVAIKDGIVTAQITAENEAVKKAIESQLVNLKENFNNQGLKVESVEVTIASHSFEENDMNNHSGDENQSGGKKNRRINTSLTDELDIIADEQTEEAVMEALGNTVSYTA